MCHNVAEKSRAALEQLAHLGGRAHQNVQRKEAAREQVRDGTVALKDATVGQCVGDDQQVHVAVGSRRVLRSRTEQDDHLWVKVCDDALGDLVQ